MNQHVQKIYITYYLKYTMVSIDYHLNLLNKKKAF
jgi:hypothetical protein